MQSHIDLSRTLVRARMEALRAEAADARRRTRRPAPPSGLRTWLGGRLVALGALVAADPRSADPCGEAKLGHPA